MRRDAPPVALLPDDAEVSELQAPAVTDEDVDRSEIPVQHLAAMKLAEHFEDAGDLASHRELRPSLAGPVKVRAEVAVPRVLEGQAVERPSIRAHQRERVEHLDRPGMTVQQLAEIGFAQPPISPGADLDADDLGHNRRAPGSPRQVDLTEAALAEKSFDGVVETRFPG